MLLRIEKVNANGPDEKKTLTEEMIINDLGSNVNAFKIVELIVLISFIGFMAIFIGTVGLSLGPGTEKIVYLMTYGIPAVFLIVLLTGFTVVNAKTKKDIRMIQKGDYEIIEDIVTRKYTDFEGHGNMKYCFEGQKCKDNVPPPENMVMWVGTQIGDVIWIIKKKTGRDEWYIRTYSSVFYELSPELGRKVEHLRDLDYEYARHTIERNLTDGSMKELPDEEDISDEFGSVIHMVQEMEREDGIVDEETPKMRKMIKRSSCGKKFDPEKHGGTCPKCGAMQLY